MPESGKRWYVAQTHPLSEARAESNLRRQGYAVYLPRFAKRRRHARRVEIVPRPLFPRYLFVGFDPEADRWRAIGSTAGVARLICQGDSPCPVPDGVVEAIRAREDAGGMVIMSAAPRFKPGDRVRMLGGVFVDCLGLFEAVADEHRVAILLDLLGRQVRVLVDDTQVAAA